MLALNIVPRVHQLLRHAGAQLQDRQRIVKRSLVALALDKRRMRIACVLFRVTGERIQSQQPGLFLAFSLFDGCQTGTQTLRSNFGDLVIVDESRFRHGICYVCVFYVPIYRRAPHTLCFWTSFGIGKVVQIRPII